MRAPELRAHGLELGRTARARAAAEEPAHEGHRGLRGAATAIEPLRLGCAVRPIWAHQGSTTARSSAFGLTASCCRWNQPIDFLGSPQPTTIVRTALMLLPTWTTESPESKFGSGGATTALALRISTFSSWTTRHAPKPKSSRVASPPAKTLRPHSAPATLGTASQTHVRDAHATKLLRFPTDAPRSPGLRYGSADA